MATADICKYLDWDSTFFSLRIGRVTDRELSQDTMNEVLAWNDRNSIDCLYYLCSTGDIRSSKIAEDAGFRLVDIRVVFSRALDHVPAADHAKDHGIVVRPGAETDLPHLKAVARVSYHNTRFYSDGRFPAALCDRLYEIWTEKSLGDKAGAIWVAETKGHIAGYITCCAGKDGEGQIGLLAVDPEFQGHGFGRRLVKTGLAWFADRGFKFVTVATQGRNIWSQRLYQSTGFMTESVHLWYHRWSDR